MGYRSAQSPIDQCQGTAGIPEIFARAKVEAADYTDYAD
jgi:hypothetical protein